MLNLTTKNVEINQRNFTISYPNVGKQFDIEAMKLLITNGGYGDLARSGHLKANKLLDMVDAFANLYHLLPELALDVTKFFQMDEGTMVQLVVLYKNEVLPFMQQCEEEINKFKEELNKQNANKSNNNNQTSTTS